jgi:polar amino acid transport system permease protein
MPTALTACIDALPSLLMGAVSTVGMLLLAMALGFVLGVPLSVAQVYGPRPLRWLAGTYVWFFRGVPILVQLYLFYFGLFALLGLNLSEFVSAAAVLGLTSSAYQSQIFRGSIQGLHAGQLKAARALGMTDRQAIASIILPQALRLSIPGWSNEYSILLKDTAVAFVIGVTEIMARTRFAASRTYEHFALYILAGVLYFVLTAVGVRLLRRLEKRVRIPGYAQQGSLV